MESEEGESLKGKSVTLLKKKKRKKCILSAKIRYIADMIVEYLVAARL